VHLANGGQRQRSSLPARGRVDPHRVCRNG
jgi:hypothetical protein